jgi:hypothetical protein
MNESGEDAYGKIFKVDIRWDDYNIISDVMWAGDIVLKEQLNIQPNRKVTLNQNKTTSQLNRDPVTGLFAPVTKFTCEGNSNLTMLPKSIFELTENSSLILNGNASFNIQAEAKLLVKAGSTLLLKSGARLNIYDSGSIEVEPGGYICVEPGANIFLRNFNSVINLAENAVLGSNSFIFTNTNCISSIQGINITGAGSVNSLAQDVFIQNETITSNRYIAGKNIYVGYDVTASKPFGNVVIKSGANIIFKSANQTFFNRGFDVEKGGAFEVIK